MPAPSVIEDRLVFAVADPGRRFTRVGLDCDDALEGRRRFRRTTSGWSLSLPRPSLSRVEYRLVVSARGGDTTVVCDPDNPERVATAFGERSVALMPGYERPAWLRNEPADKGSLREIAYTDPVLGEMPIGLWCPKGLDDDAPAPLLVAHDGPEYAALSSLTAYAAAVIDDGGLPSFRISLMQPVERDDWYAANDDYPRAVLAAVDQVAEAVAVHLPLVVMGASLGGLAALLVGLSADGRVGGVFSQSGSFFDADLDPQEASYPHFDRVTAAVGALTTPKAHPTRLLVGLTCGRLEENWANNEAITATLQAHGHDATLTGLDDLHNYTGWRDGFEPALGAVLRAVWAGSRMGR